jgi:hypothetical protein
MPMKDAETAFVVSEVVDALVVTGVLPVPIPGVWLGTLAFEHALNRQVTITVRSVPNQMKGGCFLGIVVIG